MECMTTSNTTTAYQFSKSSFPDLAPVNLAFYSVSKLGLGTEVYLGWALKLLKFVQSWLKGQVAQVSRAISSKVTQFMWFGLICHDVMYLLLTSVLSRK